MNTTSTPSFANAAPDHARGEVAALSPRTRAPTRDEVSDPPAARRRVLIVGTGPAARELAAVLEARRGEQYALVGHVVADQRAETEPVDGHVAGDGRDGRDGRAEREWLSRGDAPRVVADGETLLQAVQQWQVDELFIAPSGALSPELNKAVVAAYESGCTVTPMALAYEALTGRLLLDDLGSSWPLVLPGPASRQPYDFLKRLCDVILAVIGLLVTALLVPAIALAIRIDSPGPVFFWQERIGHKGQPFRLVKFRSMADRRAARDAALAGAGKWEVVPSDLVTPIGRFLRASRLDELPQFWNVLIGDMSLIGPRPFVPWEVQSLRQHIPMFAARQFVRPGLTGWAQVNHGYSNTPENARIKLQYDLYYIKHRSPVLDARIALMTVRVMVHRLGV